tara:strand:- start:1543 stop:3486 length:1944 start_codon:yes stop_codon:yes gene_type:complete
MNKKHELVSVVMPVFNEEKVLPFAIESVIAQTYRPLELIIINDASTDLSYEICSHYNRKYNFIRLVCNHTNSRSGPIKWEPRNDGLKYASGAYIAYLDADNTWDPRFLEVMVDEIVQIPGTVLVHCRSRNFLSTESIDQFIQIEQRQMVERGSDWVVFSYAKMDTPRFLDGGYYVDTNEMLHRADVFSSIDGLWRTFHPQRQSVNKKLAGNFPERRHNDLELFERILSQFGDTSCRLVDGVLVNYYYPCAKRQTHSLVEILNKPPEVSEDETIAALDLSVGEIGELPGISPVNWFTEYINQGEWKANLTKYKCILALDDVAQRIAASVNEKLGEERFTKDSIVLTDGCHNAIFTAISAIQKQTNHDWTLCFPVPSYPFWKIGFAANLNSIPLEAYTLEEFLTQLKPLVKSNPNIIAIIQSPGNPVGYILNQDNVDMLNEISNASNLRTIVDCTYQNFIPEGAQCIQQLGEKTILCNGISKSWGVPGLRLGYCIAFSDDMANDIRTSKRGQSLLPSPLMQGFTKYLLENFPEKPQVIAQCLNARRQVSEQLINEWIKTHSGAAVCEVDKNDSSFYSTVYFNLETNKFNHFFQDLQTRGVKVCRDQEFFPDGFQRSSDRHFLRLSYGNCHKIELAIGKILDQLNLSLLS